MEKGGDAALAAQLYDILTAALRRPITLDQAPPRARREAMMAAQARPFWRTLYFWVLVAIAAGALLGWLSPETGRAVKPLGDGFIKLVKMIITPVIFLTVVTGIAGMADLKAFGRVGGKAMAYFLTVSTLALAVGLVAANIVRPGAGLGVDPATLDPAAVATYVSQAHEQSITG